MLQNGEALRADSHSRPFWVMIIDIDHFRHLNNDYGHLIGDHILAGVGELLNRYFPDAMVVRFGGEEFAVLLPQALRKDALRRAEAVRLAAGELRPEGIDFTISIGIAGGEDYPDSNLNALLGIADMALLAGKEHGRNQTWISQTNRGPVPVQPLPVSV
jgi:two-component system cell cycle response regulator